MDLERSALAGLALAPQHRCNSDFVRERRGDETWEYEHCAGCGAKTCLVRLKPGASGEGVIRIKERRWPDGA